MFTCLQRLLATFNRWYASQQQAYPAAPPEPVEVPEIVIVEPPQVQDTADGITLDDQWAILS
jgi:hypothetical protein